MAAEPADAFRLFTDEIGLWWRRGTRYWNDQARGCSVRIEPWVGGRFVEVWDLETGEGFDIGRVTAWEPGRRLGVTWVQTGWPEGMVTEVDVRFEPVAAGTRVRIEQTGFEPLGAEAAGYSAGYEAGWGEVLGWFAGHVTSERGASR